MRREALISRVRPILGPEETFVASLPVRFGWPLSSGLPYWFGFRGFRLVLTSRRVIALRYHRLTGRPTSGVAWQKFVSDLGLNRCQARSRCLSLSSAGSAPVQLFYSALHDRDAEELVREVNSRKAP